MTTEIVRFNEPSRTWSEFSEGPESSILISHGMALAMCITYCTKFQ